MCAICVVVCVLCEIVCAICVVVCALCGVVCALFGVVCALFGVVCALFGVVCALFGIVCALCGVDNFVVVEIFPFLLLVFLLVRSSLEMPSFLVYLHQVCRHFMQTIAILLHSLLHSV